MLILVFVLNGSHDICSVRQMLRHEMLMLKLYINPDPNPNPNGSEGMGAWEG